MSRETTFNVSTLGRRRPNDQSQCHQGVPRRGQARQQAAALDPASTPRTGGSDQAAGEGDGRLPRRAGPQPAGCSRDGDTHRLEQLALPRVALVPRFDPADAETLLVCCEQLGVEAWCSSSWPPPTAPDAVLRHGGS